MSSKSKLMSGAAVLLAIAGITGGANASTTKPVKKHHAVPAESATSAQVKALTEEVNALKAELDQEVAARQQVQAQAQAAQAQAQAATDQAQANAAATQSHVDDEIKRIPGEVKSDVAAAIPPKAPSWTDNTTVTGRIFADVSDINSKVNGVKSNSAATDSIPATNGYGTDVKRFYIGVDHKFNDIFAMNVTTDAIYNTSTGTTALFIKKAYISGAFAKSFNVELGAYDNPWAGYAEAIYGYRFVERTLTDRLGLVNTVDTGVHVNGALGPYINYDVAAVNGNGYKNPTRSETVDFEGRLSAKVNEWNFGIGGYTGKLGQENPGVLTPQTATRWDALAAYVGSRATLGVQYFADNDFSSTLVTKTTPDKADGYSVFGSFKLNPVWSVFARDDQAKLSKIITPAKKDDYYNFGIDYSAVKNVDFALTYKHETLTNSTTQKIVADEVGIFTQARY